MNRETRPLSGVTEVALVRRCTPEVPHIGNTASAVRSGAVPEVTDRDDGSVALVDILTKRSPALHSETDVGPDEASLTSRGAEEA